MLCTIARSQGYIIPPSHWQFLGRQYKTKLTRLYSGIHYTACSHLHTTHSYNHPASTDGNLKPQPSIRTAKPDNPEVWQKWINYDSEYDKESDHLNRARHFFFHIDTKGKLLRRELAQGAPEKRQTGRSDEDNLNVKVENYGVLAHPAIVDRFYNNLRINRTDLYKPPYSYVSHMGHERYFATCAVAPVVFWNLSRGDEGAPWEFTYASTLTAEFDPDKLRVSPEGLMFHPVINKTIQRSIDREEQEGGAFLWGLLSTETAQMVLEHCVDDSIDVQESDSLIESDIVAEYEDETAPLCIAWEGRTVRIQAMSEEDLRLLD